MRCGHVVHGCKTPDHRHSPRCWLHRGPPASSWHSGQQNTLRRKQMIDQLLVVLSCQYTRPLINQNDHLQAEWLGTLTLGIAEHLVLLEWRNFGHELLHGLLRGHGVDLRLAVRRLVGGCAALAVVVGRLWRRGLPVWQRQARSGRADWSQPIGLGGQHWAFVGVLLIELSDMALRLRWQLDGVRHRNFRASLTENRGKYWLKIRESPLQVEPRKPRFI